MTEPTADEMFDALKSRLAAAERVCYLYGISPVREQTQREKACTQAWQAWSYSYRRTSTHLSDAEVAELAAQRDAIREATLARIRDDQ